MPPRRVRARVRALAATTLLALAIVAPPARTQEPPSDLRINLVGQPVWHAPGDDLDLVVRVVNDSTMPLEGFRLQVRVYPPVLTRSDLELNLEVPPTALEASSLPRSVDETVPPEATRLVRIENPVTALTSLTSAVEPAVYPVTITLTGLESAVPLDSLTTFLLFFPEEVEVPLQIVPVWTIAELPARGVDGEFHPHPVTGTWHLEDAVTPEGWLTTILGALATSPGSDMRLGVAASPRTVEELADMADGYTRTEDAETTVGTQAPARAARDVIQDLQSLVASTRAQPLLVPYAFPDLPSIAGDLDRMQGQLAQAEEVYTDVLDRAPGRTWVFPPSGRADRATLDDLRALGAGASTFLRADTLEAPNPADPGCPAEFIGVTYTCLARTETDVGHTRAYVLDATLQQRIADLAAVGGRVALQRVFAELAMIWDELPGTAARIVPVILPGAWNPPPRDGRLMVRTLARAPWLVTRTPEQGFRQGIGTATRPITDELQPNVLAQPPYDTIVRSARDRLESYASTEPPPETLTNLRRDLLTAHNRTWATDDALIDDGLAYAEGVQAAVDASFANIKMGGNSDITLTSRTGEIPLVLFNETDHDVTLEIDFDWTDLDLEITPEGIERTFPPGASRLPVQASATGSGLIRFAATVTAPDGTEIDRRIIAIRSTEFNEIALAITVGAFAFLVLFYVLRVFRRRDPSVR